MATSENLYIDAVIIQGISKTYSVSITQKTENGLGFEPLDLDPYSIRFTVLGSATANAEILLQKFITQNTDNDTVGRITDASNGEFSFSITGDESNTLGLGKFPIRLELLDAVTLNNVYTLTEGAYNGEFNKIQIVQI